MRGINRRLPDLGLRLIRGSGESLGAGSGSGTLLAGLELEVAALGLFGLEIGRGGTGGGLPSRASVSLTRLPISLSFACVAASQRLLTDFGRGGEGRLLAFAGSDELVVCRDTSPGAFAKTEGLARTGAPAGSGSDEATETTVETTVASATGGA